MSRIEALREDLGGSHPVAVKKIKDHLEPWVQAFIGKSPFAVLSSCDAEGNCDASPKGGQPGFIKVIDECTLLMPDIGGNRLFQSFSNFESNPKAALLFMIPGMDVTVRVNGRINVLSAEDLAKNNLQPELFMTDENSKVIQATTLSVDEAYFHCPRSFKFARLWDTEQIAANANLSIKDLIQEAL